MMRVLTCFKVTAQTDRISRAEQTSLCRGEDPLRFAKACFGAQDEAALEAALRIRDADKQAELTAVTIGTCQSHFFTELYAVGFQQCVQLPSEEDLRFCPERTAQLLLAFLREQEPYDLIFTGVQTSPGESARIPGLLAAGLGIPMIACVVSVRALGENQFWIETSCRTYEERLQVKGPVVCAMGNAEYPYLRIAGIRERMNASRKKAFLWQVPELPQPEIRTHFQKLQEIPGRPVCRFLRDEEGILEQLEERIKVGDPCGQC